jgi:hypothetical protein
LHTGVNGRVAHGQPRARRAIMASMGTAELTWHYSDADCAIASFRNVIIVLLDNTMSLEGLRASVQVNRKLTPVYGHIAVLSIFGLGVKMPSPEVRKAAADAVALTAPTTRADVRVLPGDGFWASAQRGILTAIEMMRPDSVARRTCRHMREGVSFLAARLEKDASFALELERVALMAMDERGAQAAPQASR